MTLQPQDWIALLSFAGAALSAIYARWTFSEAKKANQIAIHTHQKEIFDAFVSFRGEFLQVGEQFSDEALYNLSVASHTCDFYLPNSLANSLKEYASLANTINYNYKRAKRFESDNPDIASSAYDQIWQHVDRCRAIEKDIENEMREVLKLS